MKVEPFEWNVVVVGYWNRAILTPAGIATRLLGLDEGTPVHVEVPMDGLASIRVRHNGLVITVETGKFTVAVDSATFDDLEKAQAIAAKAIDSLPETPFKAAGFNVRYRIEDPSDELIASTDAAIDTKLSDCKFTLAATSIVRSLKWEEGVINLGIHGEPESKIELNFHKASQVKTELLAWLQRPIIEVSNVTQTILSEVIGTNLERQLDG